MIKILCFSLLALLCMGFLYEFVATQIEKWRQHPPPGKLVDIGGYRLHLQTVGEGDVTVVMDAGMSLSSLDWSLVQPELAQYARVCTYDRAGLGWSDCSPYPRDAEHIVTELHTLLTQAKIPPPYILVGHSMGGIHMRLFEKRYPNEVAGLVLVDASHEEQLHRLPPDPLLGKNHTTLNHFLLYSGIQRLLFKFPAIKHKIETPYKVYPQPIFDTYLSLLNTHKHIKTLYKEMACDPISCQQLKKYGSSLGETPLIVITAGALTFYGDLVGYPKEWLKETYVGWLELQKELVSLSRNSTQLIADKSDHLIPRHQPEIIIQGIREVIEMTQN